MSITQNQIVELNNVIQHLNSIHSEEERKLYLQNTVEDVELFVSTLKSVNKNKLTILKKKEKDTEKGKNVYTKEAVIKIFENNSIKEIVAEYSKKELTDMYLTFYSSKPLTSQDKTRIAQNIRHYIYSMNRTQVLLG